MGAYRFTTHQTFSWKGGEYRVNRLLPDGEINIEDTRTGAVKLVTHSELLEELFRGEISFGVTDASSGSLSGASHSNVREVKDLSDYPDKAVDVARWRLKAIQPLVHCQRTLDDVKQRVMEMKELDPDHRISVSSIYRWLSQYETSNLDLRSLIPKYHKRGAKGETRLDPTIEKIIQSVISDRLFVPEQVTDQQIYYEVCRRVDEENKYRASDRQLLLPSLRTINRRTNEIDEYQRLRAKVGKRSADQSYRQYGQQQRVNTPLYRVEIDHTKMDLIVIDEIDNLPLGRLTLTYCIDVATRYPLGYYLGFEPPSYSAVMECLYHAILPKKTRESYGTEQEWLAYGLPEKLVTDQGKEFGALADACQLLNIELEQAMGRTPEMKAVVERIYHSTNTLLLHGLPGTTFSNPTQKGAYNSAKHACIYLHELEQILNIFLVDLYAQRVHRGIDSTPAQAWRDAEKKGFKPRLPENVEELHILLARMVWRTIQHYGIELFGLRYNTAELAPLRHVLKKRGVPQEQCSQIPRNGNPKSSWVKVKYHPSDLSHIWVYDAFTSTYIEVPALDQEYTQGLSLWKHEVIKAKAREETKGIIDIAALGRAQQRIQEIVDNARARSSTQSRTTMARWEQKGAGLAKNDLADQSDNMQQIYESDNVIDEFGDELEDQEQDWDIGFEDLPKSRRSLHE